VGPEHFGLLVVDSSKRRFATLLTDFYGHVLLEPTEFENTEPGLTALVDQVKAAEVEHGLRDLVVGIERTGRYHGPARRALKARWDVRMIHPFATKQLRQPVDPGNKTDPTDLNAMVRAMIVGYGTEEQELPETWQEWRLISRAREDLVRKASTLRVQIQERLEGLMPGYAGLFGSLWTTRVALAVVELYGSAPALLQAGQEGICARLRQQHHAVRQDTVAYVLLWAGKASSPEPCAALQHRLLCDQMQLLRDLEARIEAYERDLLRYLVDTPVVLLLSLPGINVVSSASYGAELGPIEHYLDAKRISGRAGLYGSRYQSDETDLTGGSLVSGRNARLRDAILEIAHNLIRCNAYFRAQARVRKERKEPAQKIHVAVGNTFTRISYCLLAGRTVFKHPCCQERHAILNKIFLFAQQRHVPASQLPDLLLRASRQIPREAFPEEVQALQAQLPKKTKPETPSPSNGGEFTRLKDCLPYVIRHLNFHLEHKTEKEQNIGDTTISGGLPT
jgi:transposase